MLPCTRICSSAATGGTGGDECALFACGHQRVATESKSQAAIDAEEGRRRLPAEIPGGSYAIAERGMGEALDFQRDLQLYEDLIARSANSRRRKAYEAANHPFVDRCAFLLDSSFLEKARLAASRALGELENLSATVTLQLLQRN